MVLHEYGDSLPVPVVTLAAPIFGRDALLDPELVEILEALDMSAVDFGNFMHATRRFDTPVRVLGEYDDGYVDEHFNFKETAQEVPGFLGGAKAAGLSDAQANGLLIHILNSDQNDFISSEHSKTLWAYGELFKQKTAMGEAVDAGELQAITDLVTLTGKNDVMPDAAYAHLHATRLGLSTEQAIRVISYLPQHDINCGYTFEPFNRALRSLVPAPVDPETVVQVFTALAGDRPYYRRHLYDGLEEMVVFHGSAQRSPQQLLESIKYYLDAGMDGEDALTKVAENDVDAKQLLASAAVEVLDPAEEKDNYFFEKTGELEILGLPYRTKRSLQDGLEDLNRIAKANFAARFEVGEGMWAFDAASETWYSLGGKLELVPGALRHKFLAYDVSALSEAPLLFHVHPSRYGILVAPPRGEGRYPRGFEGHVEQYFMATPSRADYRTIEGLRDKALQPYEPRFFIVHQQGVTEYSPSRNREQLAMVAQNAQALRDDVLAEFDWADVYSSGFNKRQIVARLMGKLAGELPEGFELKLLDAYDFD